MWKEFVPNMQFSLSLPLISFYCKLDYLLCISKKKQKNTIKLWARDKSSHTVQNFGLTSTIVTNFNVSYRTQ